MARMCRVSSGVMTMMMRHLIADIRQIIFSIECYHRSKNNYKYILIIVHSYPECIIMHLNLKNNLFIRLT
jgi:hypothetical protein